MWRSTPRSRQPQARRFSPRPGQVPFSTTGLDASLRAAGRDALVLMGIATSGGVLSTVRWGHDVGYKLFVVSDACSDLDQELHRVLMEKLYPRQATILTAQTFLKAAGVA